MANSKSNFPNNFQPDLKPEEVGNQIAFFEQIREWPKVDLGDVDQLEKRIQEYFNFCSEYGVRPGVSALALSLGVSRQYVWKLEQEQSRRGATVRRAKQVIESLMEAWAVTGRINPTTWIFYGKNYFGMVDNYQLEAKNAERPLESLPDKSEIVKRIPTSSGGEIDQEPEIGLDEL